MSPRKWTQFWDSPRSLGAPHTCQSETDLVNEAISVLPCAACCLLNRNLCKGAHNNKYSGKSWIVHTTQWGKLLNMNLCTCAHNNTVGKSYKIWICAHVHTPIQWGKATKYEFVHMCTQQYSGEKLLNMNLCTLCYSWEKQLRFDFHNTVCKTTMHNAHPKFAKHNVLWFTVHSALQDVWSAFQSAIDAWCEEQCSICSA